MRVGSCWCLKLIPKRRRKWLQLSILQRERGTAAARQLDNKIEPFTPLRSGHQRGRRRRKNSTDFSFLSFLPWMSWVAYNIQPLLHKRKKKKTGGYFSFCFPCTQVRPPKFPAGAKVLASWRRRNFFACCPKDWFKLKEREEEVNRGKVNWRCFIWFNQLLPGFVKTRLKWLECCCFCCCCVCYLWNLINSSEKSPNVLYCFIAESLGEEKRQTLALVLC